MIISVIGAVTETDLALPSFPDIARFFNVSEEMVERTMSLNFLGFCLASLIYGPLSEKYGRRPIILLGSFLFLIGGIGSAFAPSIQALLWSRFFQGLGAAASFVLVFTMISDVYKGNEAIAKIGTVNALMTAALAGAPMLGGVINAYFGWQACYQFIAIWTAVTLVLLYFFLPETSEKKEIRIRDVLQDYALLLRSKRFLLSSMIPNLFAGGYMAFISILPFLYRDELGISLRALSIHQAVIIGAFSIVNFNAGKITKKLGDQKAVTRGLFITCCSTFLLLIFSFFIKIPPAWITTPLMTLFSASCALCFAVIFSASMEVFPGKNAPASSLTMALRTLLIAMTVQLIGTLYTGSLFPAAFLVALSCLLAFIMSSIFYRDAKTSSETPVENNL